MRSKDRLAELRHLARAAAGGVYRDTVEPSLPEPASQHDKHIQDIFLEVERMRGWIHELDNNTQLMRRLHADPTFHTNKNLQEQLDAAVTASNATGLKVGGALRQFETRLSARNDAGARIARLQYAAARRLYADALSRHHAALDAVRATQLSLLQQQIHLTNLSVSDEECQALLDTKNISLFVDNVRAETAEARRALRDVEARHEELTRVEAALRDVRDLFAQLAHLVAAQQDQVDSVEYYALQATEHVGTGGTELLKGTVSRTKARKVTPTVPRSTLRAARPGGQRGVLRTAGHRARRYRRHGAAQGHRQPHQGAQEKGEPHRVPGGGLRRRAARTRTHVTSTAT